MGQTAFVLRPDALEAFSSATPHTLNPFVLSGELPPLPWAALLWCLGALTGRPLGVQRNPETPKPYATCAPAMDRPALALRSKCPATPFSNIPTPEASTWTRTLFCSGRSLGPCHGPGCLGALTCCP